jgi:hypothetical protein
LYKLKIMPRDLKTPLSKTTEPSFRTAFSSAKKSGKKTFNWKSKNYTTQTAEDKAKKQGWVANIDSGNKAAREGGYPNWKSKSHKEIAESYSNQASKQLNEGERKQKKK